MPTNEERREVAARLREVRAYEPQCVIATAIGLRCVDFGECFNCHEQTFKRLADLIEPEPERTCQMELCDTGEWFTPECREEYLFCSNCKFVGYFVHVSEDADYWCAKPNYCPNCGAKVVSE